jgi:hypothetical protein
MLRLTTFRCRTGSALLLPLLAGTTTLKGFWMVEMRRLLCWTR